MVFDIPERKIIEDDQFEIFVNYTFALRYSHHDAVLGREERPDLATLAEVRLIDVE